MFALHRIAIPDPQFFARSRRLTASDMDIADKYSLTDFVIHDTSALFSKNRINSF